MAGSQWRDRLLFGGLGLTMLLHALVLFGGRTAVPAVPVAGDMPRQGRKLQGLLDGLLGGGSGDGVAGTGLLDGLTVCGALGGLLQCDASEGDFTVQGKLTVKGVNGRVILDPTTLSISSSSSKINVGTAANPHTLTTDAFKAPGAVALGTVAIAGDATLNKPVTIKGALTCKNDFRATKTLTSTRCTCAAKPVSG